MKERDQRLTSRTVVVGLSQTLGWLHFCHNEALRHVHNGALAQPPLPQIHLTTLGVAILHSHPCSSCSQETSLPCPKGLGCHFFHLMRRSFIQSRTVHSKFSSTRISTAHIATAALIQPQEMIVLIRTFSPMHRAETWTLVLRPQIDSPKI